MLSISPFLCVTGSCDASSHNFFLLKYLFRFYPCVIFYYTRHHLQSRDGSHDFTCLVIIQGHCCLTTLWWLRCWLISQIISVLIFLHIIGWWLFWFRWWYMDWRRLSDWFCLTKLLIHFLILFWFWFWFRFWFRFRLWQFSRRFRNYIRLFNYLRYWFIFFLFRLPPFFF